MPIPIINYQPGTQQQTNPLAGIIQQLMSGYAGGQGLTNTGLGIQKAQAELPYAGRLAASTAAYKEAMAKYLSSPNQSLKYLSGMGKTFVEPGVVNAIQGYNSVNPNQQNNISNNPMEVSRQQTMASVPSEVAQPASSLSDVANQSQNIQDAYELQRQKMSSDVQARNRNLFATNIEKTQQFIDPKALTQYSGLAGHSKLAKDSISSALGYPSEGYNKYLESLQGANLMAKQVRQFYGASIQPDMEKKLEKLTNPSTWTTTPEEAEKLYNQTTKILSKELGTYREALQSKKAYQSQVSSIPQSDGNNQNGFIDKFLSYKFKSPREFNESLRTLSPEQREAVKIEMHNRGWA